MKFLITGGNKGLGEFLTREFGADSIGRSDGYDITNPEDQKRIAELSTQYDVFINNAFDGPPAEDWANFGQVNVYLAVYEAWRNIDKGGHIFNIGSVGAKVIPAPEPRYKTYCVAKAALEQASKQGTQGFKQGKAKFKTTLITMDKLNTSEHPHWKPEWYDAFWPRLEKWEGTGIELADISNYIKFCLALGANNCIEETVFYCNYDIRG